MSVLESPDLDKRHAEQSLQFLANDKSVQKFDQILRANQVTAGTRKTYLFQQTFQQCLTQLSQGRRSASDFETAKEQLPQTVDEAIRRLRRRTVSLDDLEYRVELREEPAEKLMGKRLAQPYQAAWLLDKQGKRPERGDTIEFVKVLPFRVQGRNFTVKPTTQAAPNEIDVEDYALSLYTSLSQVFDPMNIKLKMNPTPLSDFV